MTTYEAHDTLAPVSRCPHRQQPADDFAKVDQTLADSFPASDPPSWTGSISRVAATSNRHSNERLVHRVRAEFLGMPGLSLTIEQAQRLWDLDARACEAMFAALIESRFLRRTDGGLFVLSGRSA